MTDENKPPENYIDRIVRHIADFLDKVPDPEAKRLYRIYAVLALTTGVNTTWRAVHDAWSAWRAETKPDHPSLVPFDELTPEVQALDAKYCDAIRSAASARRDGRTITDENKPIVFATSVSDGSFKISVDHLVNDQTYKPFIPTSADGHIIGEPMALRLADAESEIVDIGFVREAKAIGELIEKHGLTPEDVSRCLDGRTIEYFAPKRFFSAWDGGVDYTFVARDLDHAKQILEDAGVEVTNAAGDTVTYTKDVAFVEWHELSMELACKTTVDDETRNPRRTVLAMCSLGDWFCSEY